MAVVAVAAVSALASGITITSAGIAFSLTATSFLTSFATSLVLGGISRAFAPDAPKFDGGGGGGSFASVKSGGITQQVRQPIVEHRLVYGQARVSGPICYMATTDDNKYLHMVIVLAAHEVEAIDEVWINDVSIANDELDGSNIVNDGGFYDGLVRIKKHLGTDSQTADTDLVSAVSEWTSDHRGRGRAYIYCRFEFDRDKFSKIPNISAYVRGKKVVDTRDDVTKFTVNPALLTRDYLTNETYGYAEETANIDDDFTDSAANSCEEFVTTEDLDQNVSSIDTATDIITLSVSEDILPYQLGDKVRLLTTDTAPGGLATATDYYVIPYQFKDTPRIMLASSYANALEYTQIDITDTGTGTHTIRKIAEPRYAAGGIIDTAVELEDNLKDILSGMGGQAVNAGGQWRLHAAVYETPTVTITEDDLIAPMKINPKVSGKDRFNRVKGVYVSPMNLGQPQDYPAVKNSTYETQDGELIIKDYDLAFTQRPHTAQRLAKIELEKSRQEITATIACNLVAMQLQAGDTFMLDYSRLGFSSKIFEVLEWKFTVTAGSGQEAPQLGISMNIRETASALYDWASGEETAVDPAPNTSLPDPFTVAVVTGFSLDSFFTNTKELDRVFGVRASWDAHDNQFVISGGSFEIEYKETTESVYSSAGRVDGNVTEFVLPTLKPDVLYDIRIFAYNANNAKSAETLVEDFQVGTSVTTNTEDWENESLARSGDDWESDTLTAEDWE